MTRSVLAAEVIALADLFDEASPLRAQLEQALNRPMPLHHLKDSESLFDVIGKSSRTSEKRLMLDISATRQACKAEHISNIGFVRSSYNLPERLTKSRTQQALYDLVKIVRHTVRAEKWIVRNPQ